MGEWGDKAKIFRALPLGPAGQVTGDTGSPPSPVQWPGPFGGLPEARLWEPSGLRTCLLPGVGGRKVLTCNSTGMRPSLPGVSSCNPTGMPGGDTRVIPCQAPAQLTQPMAPSSRKTSSQKRLEGRVSAPGVGVWGKVWSRSGSQSSGAPWEAGASRLKPPQDARNPLPLLFSSHRHCFRVSALLSHALWGQWGDFPKP